MEFKKDLTHAERVKVVVIRDADHFVHLERPERGRDSVMREVVEFLR